MALEWEEKHRDREQGRNQPSQLDQTQLERAFSVQDMSEGLLWRIVASLLPLFPVFLGRYPVRSKRRRACSAVAGVISSRGSALRLIVRRMLARKRL